MSLVFELRPRLLACFVLAAALGAAPVPVDSDRRPESSSVTRFDRFRELPINRITPEGWIREFLQRQVTGLTGHHEILSYPYDTCLWAGEIPRRSAQGEDWWRYEQTAYLTDGMLRLGYLLDNKGLIRTARGGVDYLLAHKLANGRLGFPFFKSQWPMAVFFRVLQAEYSATGDPALLAALDAHYSSYSTDELAKGLRHVVNVEGMLWTYGLTGNRRLLENAEVIYRDTSDPLPLDTCASDDPVYLHGVTYMEEAKIPGLLYVFTGKKVYLDAAVNAFRKLDRDHLLPDGVPSSNEYLSGKDPLLSHETCDISDYTWSLGYMLMATGDATWADHIEKAIFNAGVGAVSKDFKSFQYFSSVNQVIATGTSNHNNGSVPHAYGSTWMAYWPCNEVECCAGNVHRFMPNYAARMWLRDDKGGLVAALYGPSRVSLPLPAQDNEIVVTEDTAYPFSERITFRISTKRPAQFPFRFRIPAWCEAPSVQINGVVPSMSLVPGRFATLDREFRDGDEIALWLPMKPRVVEYGSWGVGVERGPLLYALPVPERASIDENSYSNLKGKKSSDMFNFPALDIRPAGNWNYALLARGERDLQVIASGGAGYPFDRESVPEVIRVPVKQVTGWSLVEHRFTPPLPAPGSYECDGTVCYVDLVPYGATRLRISVFPRAR